MQACATRLGAGIETSRRCNGSMSQHAAQDFVVARACVKEDFAPGMPEQMHIEFDTEIRFDSLRNLLRKGMR
jgi:hypothetical protein